MRGGLRDLGYEQHDDSFRNQHGFGDASFSAPRRTGWGNGLINTIRLWNRVTPLLSIGNLALVAAVSMTVYAQILITKLPVYVGRATKELTGGTSGGEADAEALWQDLSLAFLIVFAHVSLRGCTQVLVMLIGLRWRYLLTRELHLSYFSRIAYYKASYLGLIDNVDARFTSDLSTFIKLSCGGVAPPLSSAYLEIVADVFLIATSAFASFDRAGSRITALAFIYNLVTILFAVLISIPIARSTRLNEAKEADFRHKQMRLKSYAEQVALSRGEEFELHTLNSSLDDLVTHQRALIFHYFRLSLANSFSAYGGSLFGLAIASVSLLTRQLAVPHFDIEQLTTMLGTIEILSKACQSLPAKLPHLNTISGLSERIVDLVATLDDIAAMDAAHHDGGGGGGGGSPMSSPGKHGAASVLAQADVALRDARMEAGGFAAAARSGAGLGGAGHDYAGDTSGEATAEGLTDVGFMLSVENLSFSTPDGSRQLVSGITFAVEEAFGVVVRGVSGCGKSSLIRCIAGLWSADSGRVRFGPLEDMRTDVAYIPQRPYMAVGSLRQQVLYPLMEVDVGTKADDVITQLLVDFELTATLREWGLDGVATWEEVLSAGEQQRLSFVRVIFSRPKLVILDEATSHLDLRHEAICMQRVLDEEIALLTIAHRPSVVRYHQLMLTMEPDGSTTTTPLVDLTPC